MYFMLVKKSKLFYLFLALMVIFVFFNILVKAEDDYLVLPEKTQDSYVMENEENYSDSDNDYKSSGYKIKKRSISKENKLLIPDAAFTNKKPLTLMDLVTKIATILCFLFGILFLIKTSLLRNNFDSGKSFFQSLAQTVLPNTQGLKLLQTLILTPGQNLYVIEAEGKKLLIGGTHQGGVQFLTDLTCASKNNSEISAKHLPLPHELFDEARRSSVLDISGQISSSPQNQQIIVQEKEMLPITSQDKQPFKRRVNFRQSLLTKL